MNHIAFCIDDAWCMPAGVLIKSILHYNSEQEFTFHIISKNISEESKEMLQSVLPSDCTDKILYYKVDADSFKNLRINRQDHVTLETYYRFLIPELLPLSVEKVLYMDCDILCSGNLQPLFDMDITQYSCAMGIDTRNNEPEVFKRLSYSSEYGYRCAGVLLFNLSYWRKNCSAQKCVEYLSENPDVCIWHDQDAINKILHDSIKNFNPRYDVLPGFFTVYDYLENKITDKNKNKLFVKKELWQELFDAVENPVLIHFGGKIKPWHDYDIVKPYSLLWRKFYFDSPWKNKKLLPYRQNLKGKIKTVARKLFKKNKQRYPEKAYIREKIFLEKF